jgi:lysozyme
MDISDDLLADLRRDEGLRLHAYPDPLSVLSAACRSAHLKPEQYEQLPGWQKLSGAPWTIGYGHTGADVHAGDACTTERAEALLCDDVRIVQRGLDLRMAWWRELSPVRQDAVANMAFNLGVEKLMGFTNTLRLLRAGDYAAAADNALDSAWSRQVGLGRRAWPT